MKVLEACAILSATVALAVAFYFFIVGLFSWNLKEILDRLTVFLIAVWIFRETIKMKKR